MSRMGIMGSLRASFFSRDAVILPPGDWTHGDSSSNGAGRAHMLRLYSEMRLAAHEATCNSLVVEADESRKFLRLKQNKMNGADSIFKIDWLQADAIRRKVRLHEGQKIQNKRKMSAKTRFFKQKMSAFREVRGGLSQVPRSGLGIAGLLDLKTQKQMQVLRLPTPATKTCRRGPRFRPLRRTRSG